MTEILRKWRSGLLSLAAAVVSFVTYIAPKDGISNLGQWIAAAGLHPPKWLQAENADHIVHWAAILVAMCAGLIFLLPLKALLLSKLRTPRAMEFRTLKEIWDKIPQDYVPKTGHWPASNDDVNSILRNGVIGCQATLDLTVETAIVTPHGRYRGLPAILASLAENPVKKLPILLYAYFDGADVRSVNHVLSHIKNDPIRVRGKITRADLAPQGAKGVCLNVDLHSCKVLDTLSASSAS